MTHRSIIKRKRKKRAPKHKGFFGVSTATKEFSRKDIGIALASFAGGVLAAHLVGNNPASGVAGAVITAGGVAKKNLYVSSFGTGMLFTVGVASTKAGLSGSDAEVNGFSLKNITSGAGERMGNFFKAFAGKFSLGNKTVPASAQEDESTSGLGAYNNRLNQPDFSELNSIERQLDQANGLFGDDMPTREM